MKFKVDNLQVVFPYDYVYPEQYQYMHDLKKSLDSSTHCLLEMPSGTGKTISLLSLIVAYMHRSPSHKKLIYCSRTVPEIEKALLELKRLMKYRKEHGEHWPEFLGVGLTSRKNTCLNSFVKHERSGKVVDAKCRSLTAPWVREKAKDNKAGVMLCDYYESLYKVLNDDQLERESILPAGVYTLEELKGYGERHNYCPYYLSRKIIAQANVIIYSYHYLLDPKIAELVSREFGKECIIVFDEAHNIGN